MQMLFHLTLENSHWSIIYSHSSNVNEPWRKWKYSFLDILYKQAPKSVIKVRNKPAHQLNSEIKKEMFTRDPLKRKATKSGSQDDQSAFQHARNVVNYSIRCLKSKYYRHKLNESVGDSKTTWKVLKDLMGKKSGVTEVNEILTSSNRTLNNAEDIRNHLNGNFTQIGPNLGTNLPTSSIDAEDDLGFVY